MHEPLNLEGSHAQPAGIPIPRRRAKLPTLDNAHDVVDLTSNTPERRYDPLYASSWQAWSRMSFEEGHLNPKP